MVGKQDSNVGNDISSLLPHAIGHKDQPWYKMGGDYTSGCISVGGDH